MEDRSPGRARWAGAARVAAEEFDPSSERSLESLAISGGVISFIAVAALAVPVFLLHPAPISGPGSLGEYAAIASAVVALVSFGAGRFIVALRAGTRMRVLDVVDVVALAIAHAVIAVLSWTLVAVILEASFIGAEVYPLAVIALAGAAAALTGYAAFSSATHMDLLLLAVVLAAFLVEGVIASMLTAGDPQWWERHLSALGMTGDLSALAFNLTLIVAGFIVTTLARYATAGIPTAHPHGTRSVRTCLIIVGVFLACVGVFHVDTHFWIHTAVASGMAVSFFVLVIRIRRWIPGVSRTFVLVGWTFMAVIVVLAVFFAIGIYTLTAVELVAGVLVFTWIILFIRHAAALTLDSRAGQAS